MDRGTERILRELSLPTIQRSERTLSSIQEVGGVLGAATPLQPSRSCYRILHAIESTFPFPITNVLSSPSTFLQEKGESFRIVLVEVEGGRGGREGRGGEGREGDFSLFLFLPNLFVMTAFSCIKLLSPMMIGPSSARILALG